MPRNMNNKQSIYLKALKHADIEPYVRNENQKPADLSLVKTDTNYSSLNEALQRLHALEEQNSRLENLVIAKSNLLAETVATNAKFVSILAHDLRSPFSSILGVLEILKVSLSECNVTEMERYIDMAEDSANRTLSLLENLLVWTISQNKEKNFNPIKTDLFEIVSEEVENSYASAKQKQISLAHSIEPGLYANADIQILKTILRNLIGNAIKYSKEGGEITISASEKSNFIEISVQDNGIGIPASIQKDLFKSHELQSTLGTHNEQGTGLGLLLCKEFVTMHNGTIRVESEQGKGSRFFFTIPHYI